MVNEYEQCKRENEMLKKRSEQLEKENGSLLVESKRVRKGLVEENQ